MFQQTKKRIVFIFKPTSKKMIKPIFPIKGADLKYIGYEPGPQMGIMIDALELIWINSGFNTSKENLLLAAEHLD